MKYGFKLFVLICSVVSLSLAQHGVHSAWGQQVPLPKVNANAKQRGVLYNNMVTTSDGRIIVSTAEINPSNLNQIYGYYITYSDDGGKTWLNPPIRFTPIDKVIGGSSLKLAIDKNDTVYALWNSASPSALFISKLDKNLNMIKDSVRIATKINYPISSTNMTIDRYNRIHVMWNEGSTGSSQITEVYYSRSTDRGITWQAVQRLSQDDGHHSAFPHAQFDHAGDTLAIPWRDSVGGVNKWDVYMSYSTNGGATWSPTPAAVLSGVDSEWDPDLIIDPYNRIHLFYTVYPAGDPFNGARNYYMYSDNIGNEWKRPSTPLSGMISANYRSQLLEGTRYDATRNVLYTTWKDERDFDTNNGNVHGDIMVNYSLDRGLTWSTPEFVTDCYDSTVGFKAGDLLPTGEYCINYEIMYPEDIYNPSAHLQVYFKKRSAVVTSVTHQNILPNQFTLYQNYPNPFNPSTVISFQLPVSSHVTLKVFDVIGREVATLVEGEKEAGSYEVKFDAGKLSSGIYFAQMQNGDKVQMRKLLLMK